MAAASAGDFVEPDVLDDEPPVICGRNIRDRRRGRCEGSRKRGDARAPRAPA
jgi:hypothetical protein